MIYFKDNKAFLGPICVGYVESGGPIDDPADIMYYAFWYSKGSWYIQGGFFSEEDAKEFITQNVTI